EAHHFAVRDHRRLRACFDVCWRGYPWSMRRAVATLPSDAEKATIGHPARRRTGARAHALLGLRRWTPRPRALSRRRSARARAARRDDGAHARRSLGRPAAARGVDPVEGAALDRHLRRGDDEDALSRAAARGEPAARRVLRAPRLALHG